MNEPAAPSPVQHQAPEGWKPISGLALLAFISSLVLFAVAIFGVWIVLVVPLVLALLALKRFDPARQRGRSMAIWALVISVGGGGFAYAIHQSGRVLFSGIGESFLSALSAESEPEKRDAALRPWTSGPALEKDPALLETWRARFDQVTSEMGPWSGEMAMPSILKGVLPLFSPPEKVVEVGSGEKAPPWVMGSVFWVPARFEKGIVYLALVVHEGDAEAVQAVQKELKGTDPVPIFGDLRFFRDAP